MLRRIGLVASSGLVLLLVACGSGTNNQTTPSTNIPSTSTMSTAQIQQRLLTAADVGAAWRVGQSITPEDLSSLSTSVPCPGPTVSPAVAQRLTAVTGVQFEPTDQSYKHLIELVLSGEPKQLDSDLQALFEAMDSCSALASTATGATKLTIQKLAVPKLGDQQAAYVMTDTESPDSTATWYVRNAVVRVGSTGVAVGLAEILATPQDKPQISDETFGKILESAVGKLRG